MRRCFVVVEFALWNPSVGDGCINKKASPLT